MTSTTTKPGVLAEIATMRKRFVACAIHSGSDKELAEGACESFDEARATVERLAEAAANMEAVIWLWRETGQAPNFAPLTTADDALRAALAAFNGEQS